MPYFMRLEKPIKLHNYYCGIKTFGINEMHEERTPVFTTLLLVFSGTLSFTENDKRVDVPAGSYYIQRQGTKQGGVPISDPPIYGYLHFTAEFDETDNENALPLSGSIDPEQMRHEMLQLNAIRPKVISTETLYRFYKILHILKKSRHEVVNPLAAEMHDYILANATTIESVDDLAKRFSYSREHLSRIFKQEYGTTPHSFIMQARIDTACRLLKTSNLSVGQIAEMCGFSDFSVFWRRFKAVTGKAPLQVKKDKNFDI